MRAKTAVLASFVAAFVFQLGGCASAPELHEPAYVRGGYELLFSKGEGSNNFCAAGFRKDGLLYVVTDSVRYPDGRYLSVIDPQSGVFFYTKDWDLEYKKYRHGQLTKRNLDRQATCRDANFTEISRLSWGEEPSLIVSPGFRAAIVNLDQDSTALANEISSGPGYFRYEGKWKNESMETVDIFRGQGRINRESNLAHVAQFLKSVNQDVAQKLVKDSVLKRAAEEQKRRDDSSRRKADLDGKQRLWDQRMQYKLNVGDPVCTYDSNLFGNIEAVSGARLKVHVIGQIQGSPGTWFHTLSGYRLQYAKVDSPRWFNREELASCSFND